MNAMSREGWNPRLELWQEAGTLLHKIYMLTVEEQGMQFNSYHASLDGGPRESKRTCIESVTQVITNYLPWPECLRFPR